MTKFESFLEQVKFISFLRAIEEKKLNYETILHALAIDHACIKDSHEEIYEQAIEFVNSMITCNGREILPPGWFKKKAVPLQNSDPPRVRAVR